MIVYGIPFWGRDLFVFSRFRQRKIRLFFCVSFACLCDAKHEVQSIHQSYVNEGLYTLFFFSSLSIHLLHSSQEEREKGGKEEDTRMKEVMDLMSAYEQASCVGLPEIIVDNNVDDALRTVNSISEFFKRDKEFYSLAKEFTQVWSILTYLLSFFLCSSLFFLLFLFFFFIQFALSFSSSFSISTNFVAMGFWYVPNN